MARAVRDSALIFIGTFTGRDVTDDDASVKQHHVTFAVSETLKGPHIAKRQLSSAPIGGRCGYSFKKGRRYLVYTEADASVVSWCSRTQPIEDATLEVAALRAGLLPLDPIAVQRQVLSCSTCVEAGKVFSGDGEKGPAWTTRIATALDAGTAFVISDDMDRSFGRSTRGEYFELETTVGWSPCTSTVKRRVCQALDVSSEAVCTRAGPWSTVCDESLSQKTEWLAPAPFDSSCCLWRSFVGARCSLPELVPGPRRTNYSFPPELTARCFVSDAPGVHDCELSQNALSDDTLPHPRDGGAPGG